MPSAWVERYETPGGGTRFRARYTLGGKGARRRHGGSFQRKADANLRVAWLRGQLAAMRVPNLSALAEDASSVSILADRWLASRIDVAEATAVRHGVELKRIEPAPRRPGRRRARRPPRSPTSSPRSPRRLQARSRSARRSALAMVLDHAGVDPNPARDRPVRLPARGAEEINPPTAEHVEAVYRLLPPKHRLALLFLDWSGARVVGVDTTLVGDYDEPRRRVRLRAATTKTREALWVELPPVLADAIEATLGRRARTATSSARCSPAPAPTRCGRRSRRRARPPASRCGRPHDLATAGSRCCTCAAAVGSDRRVRRPAGPPVTADTYTHVLIDEGELDYAELMR